MRLDHRKKISADDGAHQQLASNAFERALAARANYLFARDAATKRRYEAALRACSEETARALIDHVGPDALTPAEQRMPRLGAAWKQGMVWL